MPERDLCGREGARKSSSAGQTQLIKSHERISSALTKKQGQLSGEAGLTTRNKEEAHLQEKA